MSDASAAFADIQHLTSNICFVCKLKTGEFQEGSIDFSL
jgi:hypothetical protein